MHTPLNIILEILILIFIVRISFANDAASESYFIPIFKKNLKLFKNFKEKTGHQRVKRQMGFGLPFYAYPDAIWMPMG